MKVLAILLTTALLWAPQARAEPVTVFAAASLTGVMTVIGEKLQSQGIDLRFSFAASSTLARQIEAGAPADLYFSANDAWMDHLERSGLISPTSRVSPIGNRLVAIAGPGWSGGDLDAAGLARMLPAGQGPVVIGDPAHVPAGIYAKQALEHLGLWENEALVFAFADNVRAALALVETGEADFGVVYATDAAFSEAVTAIFHFPPDSHAPISYPLALLEDAPSDDASVVYEFLLSDEARAIFLAHGFEVLE